MTWAACAGLAKVLIDVVADVVIVLSLLASFLGRWAFVVIVVDEQDVVRTSWPAISSRAIFSHYRIAFKFAHNSHTYKITLNLLGDTY